MRWASSRLLYVGWRTTQTLALKRSFNVHIPSTSNHSPNCLQMVSNVLYSNRRTYTTKENDINNENIQLTMNTDVEQDGNFTEEIYNSTKDINEIDDALYIDSTWDQPEQDILYKYIDIEVRGHDTAVLKSYGTFVMMAAEHLGITLSDVGAIQKPIWWLITLPKSVFVKKKNKVQYETNTHIRNIQFKHLTGSTADTFLEYIQRNLPEGVAMKVTKHTIEPLSEQIDQPPKSAGKEEQMY